MGPNTSPVLALARFHPALNKFKPNENLISFNSSRLLIILTHNGRGLLQTSAESSKYILIFYDDYNSHTRYPPAWDIAAAAAANDHTIYMRSLENDIISKISCEFQNMTHIYEPRDISTGLNFQSHNSLNKSIP